MYGVYSTWFDTSAGVFRAESASTSGYKSLTGSDAIRLVAAASIDGNVAGVWFELDALIRSGKIAECEVPKGTPSSGSGTTPKSGNWAITYEQTLNKIKSWHKLELVKDGYKTTTDVTVNGEDYVRYGPISLRFGGAGISTAGDGVAITNNIPMTISWYSNKPEDKPLNAETMNTAEDKTSGEFTYGAKGLDGSEARDIYIWIKRSDIPESTQKITVKFKQANLTNTFKESAIVCCGDGVQDGQSNLRYVNRSKTINGGTDGFTLAVTNETTKIKVLKRDKVNQDKKIDMEFIVKVKNKGYLKELTNKTWTYTKNANDAKRFTTKNGEKEIEYLPVGKTVHIYETKVLTEGYDLSSQPKKRNLDGVECCLAGSVDTVKNKVVELTAYNTPEIIKITVVKKWAGTPKSGNKKVQIVLKANGETAEVDPSNENPVTIDGNGKYVFKNLPKSKDGKEIEYTVEEMPFTEDQKDVKLQGIEKDKVDNGWKFTITNVVNNIDITVKKVWKGTPKSGNKTIKATLYANGTSVGDCTINGNDSYTFSELPLYDESGGEIHYTVDETLSADQDDVVKKVPTSPKLVNGTYVFEIENSVNKTQVTVSKIWKGISPTGLTVTINLLANGSVKDSVTISGNGSHTFTDLPTVDSSGSPISYDAEEVSTSKPCEKSKQASGNNITFINTVQPDSSGGGDITIQKVGGDMTFKIYAEEIYPVYKLFSYSSTIPDTTSPSDYTSQNRTSYNTKEYSSYEYIYYRIIDYWTQDDGYAFTDDNKYEYEMNGSSVKTYNGYPVVKKDAYGDPKQVYKDGKPEKETSSSTKWLSNEQTHYKLSYTHQWYDIVGSTQNGDYTISATNGRWGEKQGWYIGSSDRESFSSNEGSAKILSTKGGICKISLPAGRYTIYELSSDPYYDLELQDGYVKGKEYRIYPDSMNLGQDTQNHIESESTLPKSFTVRNEIKRGNLTVNKKDTYGKILTEVDIAIYCHGAERGRSGWINGGTNYVNVKWWDNPDQIFADDPVVYHLSSSNGTVSISGLPIGTYTIYELNCDELYIDKELQSGYNQQTGRVELATITVTGSVTGYTVCDCTNRYTRGNIRVDKKGENGENLDDTKFAVYCERTTGGNYSGWLTGQSDYSGVDWSNISGIFGGSTSNTYQPSNGSFEIKGLPEGTYKIYEIVNDELYYDLELQEGYIEGDNIVLANTVNVVGDAPSNYITVTCNNRPTRGNLKITKIGQFNERLNDIKFAIECVSTKYGSNVHHTYDTYSGWLTGENDYLEVEWSDIESIFEGSMEENTYTIEDGEITITGLPEGTYKVYEISSEQEYYDTERQSTYEDGAVELDEIEITGSKTSVVERQYKNEKTRGSLQIKKVGEAGEPLNVDIAIMFNENGKYLSGETDYASCFYPEYMETFSDVPVIYNVDGDLEINGIFNGTYTIIEYKNYEDYYDIEGQQGYNGEYAELGTYEVKPTADNRAFEIKTLENRSTRGNLNLKKLLPNGYGSTDTRFEIHVDDEVLGESYWLTPMGLYGDYNYRGIDYRDIPRNGGIFETSIEGEMRLICVPIGTYTIYETRTHSIEYALEDQGEWDGVSRTLLTTVHVTGATDDTTWTEITKEQVRRPKGDLQIYKEGYYANDGIRETEVLKGVGFIISSDAVDVGGWKTADQKYVYIRPNEAGEDIVDFTTNRDEATVFITGEDGKVTVKGLYVDLGPYNIEEVSNENLYYNDIMVIEGEISNIEINEGQTTYKDVTNPRTSGNLQIKKVDSVYSGENSSKTKLNLGGAKYKVRIIKGEYVDIPSSGLWLRELDRDENGEVVRFGDYYERQGSNYSYTNYYHDIYLIDDVKKAATFESDENGEVNINRIINGVYEIWEVETPEGYILEKQPNYDPALGMVKIGTVEVKTLNNNSAKTTLKNDKIVIQLDGHVWEDVPDGKNNQYNELEDTNETKLDGITVELYDKKRKKVIATTTTSNGGYYQFTTKNAPGYEQENVYNVYSSPETDPRFNYWELANCYVRFIYDNIGTHDENGFIVHEDYGYVVVDPFVGDDITINSKAKEYSMPKEKLQEMNLTGTTGDCPGIAITKPGPNNTDSYAEFNDYKEVLAYESKPAQDKLLTGYYNNETYTINNINLGLKAKIEPDFTITQDVAYMKVQFGNYVYKYEYMSENEQISRTVPTVNQQNSARTFTGQIYPSDVAYNIDSTSDTLKVYMVYRIVVKNNTTTDIHNDYTEQKMYLSSLTNMYDPNRYELSKDKSGVDIEEVIRDVDLWSADGQDIVRYDVNNENNPYYDGIGPNDYEISYVQFRLVENAVETILTKSLTPQDIVKAPSQVTATTYHDFWRQDNLWNDSEGEEKRYENYTENKKIIDYNKSDYLHKSWEQRRTTSELYMRFDLPEKEREIKGTVFEDLSEVDETKIGNGKLEPGEKRVSEVLVELVERKQQFNPSAPEAPDIPTTLFKRQGETYSTETAAQIVTVDGSSNAEFTFTGVIPGYYFLKFTYGDGIVKYTNIDGTLMENDLETVIKNSDGTETKVKPTDYKSTIISDEISESIIKAMEKDNETSDEYEDRQIGQWYKALQENNYSVAIDDLDKKEWFTENREYIINDDLEDIGTIPAYTPKTYISIENDNIGDWNSTEVDIDVTNPDETIGQTEHYNQFYGFNLGIILAPETKIELKKKMVNVEFTTNQGSQLVSANPERANSRYLTDLDRTTEGGSMYSKLELDPKLIDNSRVQITYQIDIQNKSDKSWVDRTHYMFGTGGVTPSTVEVTVVDQVDQKYEYDELEKVYDKVIAESGEEKEDGSIQIDTKEDLKVKRINPDGTREEETIEKYKEFSNWTPIATGEKQVVIYKVYDTLQTAIEDSEFNNDALIYKMKLSTLTTLRTLNSNPWDPDMVEKETTFVITPSTGGDRTNTYWIAGTLALMVLATGIVAIKKCFNHKND